MVTSTLILSLVFISTMLYADSCRLVITPSYLATPADSPTRYSAVCSCENNNNIGSKFTWYRHGKLLVFSKRVEVEVGNSERIFFHRLRVEDEGEYTCVFNRADGSSTSSSFQVYVSPQLDIGASYNLSISVGSTVELPCPVKSLEKHSTLSVQWNLPNDVQLSVANQKNGRLAYLPEKKSVLLAQAERADSGAYGCYASNEAGFVTFVWQINVQGFIAETAGTSSGSTSTNSRSTQSASSLSSSSIENSSVISEKETSFLFLSNPIYLTLIIVALLFTCTLILITVIISIACICGACHNSKVASEEVCASSSHRTSPLSNPRYYTEHREYTNKSGLSPAPSLLSLVPHSTRCSNGQVACCVTDSQHSYVSIPNKHPPYPHHVRCPSDQVGYHYVSTPRIDAPCTRCCPSVTMSEPRISTYSPRLAQKCTSKKHSLPDRIEEPHPLTMAQSCGNTMYRQASVDQVDV